MAVTLETADTLDYSRGLPDGSVDLVFCSPPYSDARTYGIGFSLRGQAWVDWAVERFVEHCRICKGLVAWVVEGRTKQRRWSAEPALLMTDLHRRGIKLRKPPIFSRVGVPGSGCDDWLRNDYEFIVCSSPGKLPWSDNTAMGKPPKYAPGGEMSYRLSNGSRRNQWGGTETSSAGSRRRGKDENKRKPSKRPGLVLMTKAQTRRRPDGSRPRDGEYVPPVIANPGNIIRCKVGGGVMGSRLAHENEAPFPESLCEFFIRSFCPPDGIVYDGFCGSGTTGAVAVRTGRQFIGTDIRESQIELTKRRLAHVQRELIA